jgi:hypothetical protein
MAMNVQPTDRDPGAQALGGREASPGERRLAASRAALAELLGDGGPDTFPRSQTMRFLLGGKGRVIAVGAFAGLAVVKPKLAMSLMRFMPLGKLLPVARTLLQSLR